MGWVTMDSSLSSCASEAMHPALSSGLSRWPVCIVDLAHHYPVVAFLRLSAKPLDAVLAPVDGVGVRLTHQTSGACRLLAGSLVGIKMRNQSL